MSALVAPRGPVWNVWGDDPNARDAWLSTSAPRVAWPTFLRKHFAPRPGEHALILGSTGSGKTHLQNSLLHKWPFTVTFETKTDDVTMEKLIRDNGYEQFATWHRLTAKDHPRRVIWPPGRNLKTMQDKQKTVFEDAMEKIWVEGGRPKEKPVGWCVAMDEVWWFANVLGMAKYINIYLQQGRSSGISLFGASQRPNMIPTAFYSQPTHMFFFREKERRNLDRLSELDYGNSTAVKFLVSSLEKFQVLYLNQETGLMLRTRAPY